MLCTEVPSGEVNAFQTQKVLQKVFYHLFIHICYDDSLVLLHITKINPIRVWQRILF